MIFDALEQTATVFGANFATDLSAICATKGVTAPSTASVIIRQTAEAALRHGTQPPLLAIYCDTASTQAVVQGRRDATSAVIFEYFDRAATPDTLTRQSELAAEAILKGLDRLQGSGRNVWEAAGLPNSVEITFNPGYEDAPEGEYQRLVTVTAPIQDQQVVP